MSDMRNYKILDAGEVYEDTLPEDMTMMDYHEWYEKSWVDGVRIGPAIERLPPTPEAKDA